MINTIKKHTISFKHAFDGIIWAFQTQPNFKIHVFISIIVCFFGFYFRFSTGEWFMLVLTISMGLVIEMINTAIEATTDAIDLKVRPDIKIAKDVSAGAMLIYSISAVIIGGLLFLPKLFLL